MTILNTLIIVLLLLATSCNKDGRQDFSLTIKHYAGAAGLTLIYDINENGLKVETNCDLQDCKQKKVYERRFSKNECDSIYQFIISLHLDTLKSSYETYGVLDGLFTKLSFKNGFFSSHSSTFDNFDTPTTDTLFRFVDNLVLTKKYRFLNWGQDD
jgi:hypothetical protein